MKAALAVIAFLAVFGLVVLLLVGLVKHQRESFRQDCMAQGHEAVTLGKTVACRHKDDGRIIATFQP